ncbi:Cgn [Columba guinea]|nr:Cgn [Columba guinea]
MEQQSPLDHGVQIRFITDLQEPRRPPRPRGKAGTYGVAVRVQGIAGQPFVVLNSGDKGGDSFGLKSTPDLLRDQREVTEPGGTEDPKELIYGILREGSNESEMSLKRKTLRLLEKLQELAVPPKATTCPQPQHRDLARRVEELQEKLDEETKLRQKLELPGEPAKLREAEGENRRLRAALEAKSQELQRRMQELSTVTAAKDQLETRLRQHQEQLMETQQELDRLRQDPGAAPDGDAAHKDQASLESERQRIGAVLRNLQRELEESTEETGHWRDLFQKNKDELRAAKQELLQVKLEREELEDELRELRERLAAARQETERVRGRAGDPGELDALRKELREAREQQRELEEQQQSRDEQLRQREQELAALRNEASGHTEELERLRRDLQQLREERDEATKVKASLESARAAAEQARGAAESGRRELQEQNDDLRRKIQGLEEQLKDYERLGESWEGSQARLKDRLEESLGEAGQQEQELCAARRQREEAERALARLAQEQRELSAAVQDERRHKEQLQRSRDELEEQKRLLDRTTQKLNKELEQMSQESQRSLAALRAQLDEFRDKSRRELAEAQKQAQERGAELESARLGTGRLQDEEKAKRLEEELEEEKATVELLTERVTRSRDQLDQLRAELLQERSGRQDLECDKVSLERQNKELKSRLASAEGLQRPSGHVPQLEARVQELQERLQAEEREKSTLLSSNRKLERKVKELSIQIEDERQHVSDQKDQLSLRVKALKRQVDEAEEEIERLEGARKKAQRELEEQQELNEQLQNRVTALEKEAWRKAARSAADSSLRDEPLSSDEESDSAYGPSSIASLLNEPTLQTSSC